MTHRRQVRRLLREIDVQERGFRDGTFLPPQCSTAQKLSCCNEVARLEALGKSAEDWVEKFERFVSLGSISPESCEADANTEL
jgi:hypothetical protein